jgi:hypothetical protein
MSDTAAPTHLITLDNSHEIAGKMHKALVESLPPASEECMGFGWAIGYNEDAKLHNCAHLFITHCACSENIKVKVHMSPEMDRLYRAGGGWKLKFTMEHEPTRFNCGMVGASLTLCTRLAVEEATEELIKILDILRV